MDFAPQPTHRILSGIQPTGDLHLGNYLGALKNFVRLQDDFDCLYCVVDLHAVTTWQDPTKLAQQTREIAAAYLAAGLDPAKSILFHQSAVRAHSELGWLFNCVARMGWLQRMTQFKDKAGKNAQNVSVGLFNYPVLQAADILVYRATHVPVGEDQKQHLELARDIGQKFNHDFGADYFPLTEPLIQGPATRLMSLRDGTKKMSKSDPSDYSRINLSDDADTIALKFRKAKTDVHPLPTEADLVAGQLSDEVRAARPEAVNLLEIFGALTDRSQESLVAEFGGQAFRGFKEALADVAVQVLAPKRDAMVTYLNDPAQIDAILKDGAARAAALADPVMEDVRALFGFLKV